ncbi:MAG: helix-turn-helix domain-containing protein [Treponema sp.]|nr:helix-turn-helix domain-containing protein [Treponema sp.]
MSRFRNKPPVPPPNLAYCIGRRLQYLRKKRGLTQKELAEKIGLTREAVASYESGRARLMDMILIDLAAALRVSTDEILGLKAPENGTSRISRRLIKRMLIIEGLPDCIKKHIIRTLDDSIRANTRLSILNDPLD